MPVVSQSNTMMRDSAGRSARSSGAGGAGGRQSNSESVPSTRSTLRAPSDMGYVPLEMRPWPLLSVVLGLAACKVKDPPPVTETWTDNFERNTPGRNYYKTGPGY